MAIVKKPRFGIHIFYNNGAKVKSWFNDSEGQDRAYWRAKADGKVKYVKKIQR